MLETTRTEYVLDVLRQHIFDEHQVELKWEHSEKFFNIFLKLDGEDAGVIDFRMLLFPNSSNLLVENVTNMAQFSSTLNKIKLRRLCERL